MKKKKLLFLALLISMFFLGTLISQCGSDVKKDDQAKSTKSTRRPLKTTPPKSKELANIILGFDGNKIKRIKGDPLLKKTSAIVPYKSHVVLKNIGKKTFYVGPKAIPVRKGKSYRWTYANGRLQFDTSKKALLKGNAFYYIKTQKF